MNAAVAVRSGEPVAIDARTKQILWGRAGARCSFPSCRSVLVQDASNGDRAVLSGENAHIVSQSPDGPRGREKVPGSAMDGYENLLLLCLPHHDIVDTQVNTYPVEKLLLVSQRS